MSSSGEDAASSQTDVSDQQSAESDQTAGSPPRKKPKGRTLSDILGDSPFSAAELEMLKCCAEGSVARIAKSVPSARTNDNVVRPGLIRFLALGGDESTPVHERGVSIHGAWIEGSIDFQGCEVTGPLSISDCNIAGNVILNDAKIANLNLGGSTINQLRGDRLKCSASILLRNNFHAKGVVRLPLASIAGDLELVGARIDGDHEGQQKDKLALFCARIEIGGGLLALTTDPARAFSAGGAVNFAGARVGGEFSFGKATFAAGLYCELAEIGGSFNLGDSSLAGRVRLLGVEIGGDLHFQKCNLNLPELVLTRAHVNGRLIFREVTGSVEQISLRAAKVNALVDDTQSWNITSHLILDGFQYERILDIGFFRQGQRTSFASPVDARSRLRWLKLQGESDLGKDFKPQPWEQLARVLAVMGHDEDARAIAIEKQKQKRAALLIQSRANNDGPARRCRLLWQITLHYLYGMLSRYGYRPGLIVVWALGVAVVSAVIFGFAGQAGVMAPTDRAVVANSSFDNCRPNRWTTCRELSGKYPDFSPVIYSFDLILPVIATQHVREWGPLVTKPDGSTWRFGFLIWLISRAENLFGWIAGLMFVATVAGLIKRD